MIGIFLTLLAVFLVICLAFCYSDLRDPRRDVLGEYPHLEKTHGKRG